MLKRKVEEPLGASASHPPRGDASTNLGEICYQMIVNFGVEETLASIGRAARARAADYLPGNRRLYLRHQRVSSKILAVHEEIVADAEQVDRIVAEEEKKPSAVARSAGA